MKLILGLGNIGTHFDGTRHNTGFALLDAVAEQFGFEWIVKDKFKAHIAEGVVESQKIILAKPTTYYNLSGETARAIKNFYKIDNHDILIVHDELALPFGTIRSRTSGSDAGNNGIKNIITHAGTDVSRLRVGIANTASENMDATDFVLGHFSREERQSWPLLQEKAINFIHDFIHDDREFEHTSVRIIT